jgi:hypothetical protein
MIDPPHAGLTSLGAPVEEGSNDDMDVVVRRGQRRSGPVSGAAGRAAPLPLCRRETRRDEEQAQAETYPRVRAASATRSIPSS